MIDVPERNRPMLKLPDVVSCWTLIRMVSAALRTRYGTIGDFAGARSRIRVAGGVAKARWRGRFRIDVTSEFHRLVGLDVTRRLEGLEGAPLLVLSLHACDIARKFCLGADFLFRRFQRGDLFRSVRRRRCHVCGVHRMRPFGKRAMTGTHVGITQSAQRPHSTIRIEGDKVILLGKLVETLG